VTEAVGSNIVFASADIRPMVSCWYPTGVATEISEPTLLQAVLDAGFTEIDPQFQSDTEKGSFALSTSSPAADQGSGAADADGSPADIGAFGGPHSDWWKEYPWALD
jgi:hypothetical protein